MKSSLLKKEYAFVWSKDTNRKAVIIFKRVDFDRLEFLRCDFIGVNGPYDLDDWEFLGDLAAEIKWLCEKEGKG